MDVEQEPLSDFQKLSVSEPVASDAAHQDILTSTPAAQVANPSSNDASEVLAQHPVAKNDNQRTSVELLQEFDPLGKSPGQTGHDAKEKEGIQEHSHTSDIHAPRDGPSTQASLGKSQPSSANEMSPPTSPGATSISGFSLANIARSFSIPKVRTSSIDKTQRKAGSEEDKSGAGPSEQRSTMSHKASELAPSPSRKGEDNVDSRQARSEPPPFDFQLFLDQMKARSAEPVAKYLRSYVNAFYLIESAS